MQTTISREGDVERKIKNQEENRKKIRCQHQELNFRVQNLDENRQFLFKQTTDYEQKLTNQATKQKKILMKIDKLKTQLNDIDHIRLRSISLNLKGATELKDGTMQKIPKLKNNKIEIEQRLNETSKQHKECQNVIDELSQKRDSLRRHLMDAQKQHDELQNAHKKQIETLKEQKESNLNELIEVEMSEKTKKEKREKSEVIDNEMTTIFDNTESEQQENSINGSESTYNKKEWNDRISAAVSVIDTLHSELNICEKSLESKHLFFGKVVLQKLNLEKDFLRIKDMIKLQQETLQSIESSLVDYSLQQQKYLKMRVDIQSQLDSLQITLKTVKDEMKKYRDDIQAIKEAATSLSQKKFDLANNLKKCIDKELEIEDGLKILHRNRMSLRSRKSQLLKQQMSVYEMSNESNPKYTTKHLKIIRCDCKQSKTKKNNKSAESEGVIGTLVASRDYVEFEAAAHDEKRYYVKHELIDISHSNLTNYSSTTQRPMLLLYLNKKVLFQGQHSKHSKMNVGNDDIDNCYKFKLQNVADKDVMLSIHNFIETKRDLLEQLKEHKKAKKKQKNNFSIWDIEIEDEFYCDCTSGFELRQIVSSCPSRTHIWRWKLFYSTAIHGISMNTLYKNCEDVEESILIIKDSTNCVFGAFIDVQWSVCTEYRGSIDCFVFQFVDKQNVKKKDEENKEEESKHNDSKHAKHKFIVYRSSGNKSYVIRNDMESITIGAGECPSIYFDADLNFGRSTNCSTFSSPQLTLNTQFQITTLEIWGPSNV